MTIETFKKWYRRGIVLILGGIGSIALAIALDGSPIGALVFLGIMAVVGGIVTVIVVSVNA